LTHIETRRKNLDKVWKTWLT